jgi:hypothetical protein
MSLSSSKRVGGEGFDSYLLHYQLIKRGETHRPHSVILSEAKNDQRILEQVSSSLQIHSMVQLDQ